MAYRMQFRIRVKLIPGGTGDADPNDPTLADVGTFENVVPPAKPADGTIIIYSESRATSMCSSLVRRLQQTAFLNVRGEVSGQPVGSAETGNPDLTADQKAERVYVTLDTPNPALLIAIAKANKKAPVPGTSTGGITYGSLTDNVPEIDQTV